MLLVQPPCLLGAAPVTTVFYGFVDRFCLFVRFGAFCPPSLQASHHNMYVLGHVRNLPEHVSASPTEV